MHKWSLAFFGIVLAVSLSFPGVCQADIGDQTGFVAITSIPGEAQVIMDGIYRGNTPVTLPFYNTGSPSHVITVIKPGYIPWTRTYDMNPAEAQNVRVTAVLEPGSGRGTLTVTSSPPGALVSIDGTMGQQAPWTYSDLPSGGHIVRAMLSGYQPYLTLVNVPPGETITVNTPLAPLSRIGALQVKSTPGGADIYIDGFYSGSTAATIGNLGAGQHFILLRLAGYRDWLGTIEVPENSVAFVDGTLEVASAAPTGDLLVTSNPPGAAVFYDGVFQGTTMPGDALDLTGLSPGKHALRVSLQNFQDYQSEVEVTAGRVTPVHADLVPVTNPSQNGSVLVNSDPLGANVFLDNACVGITPLMLPSVPSGNHALLLRLSGYNDYSTTMNVLPGSAVQIQAALARVAPTTTTAGFFIVIGAMAVTIALKRK